MADLSDLDVYGRGECGGFKPHSSDLRAAKRFRSFADHIGSGTGGADHCSLFTVRVSRKAARERERERERGVDDNAAGKLEGGSWQLSATTRPFFFSLTLSVSASSMRKDTVKVA
ncbi:hypothetical protein HPP92_003709 [Vanilla planifolia]|uniref:Uncharacterized protein n=1 Tax=Vanilla planifolia TaxID=51239 RepID=A0A835SG59_VANPL|nr:hypothetical protein HPP92_003709 [Vanilla planifolia]